MLSSKAKIAGILGWPVQHSLSPRLHNYWLSHFSIDGAYIPLPVKPEDFAYVIRALPKMGFRGANLTIPHKEMVVPMLDSIDDLAKALGAVNTLIITQEGKLHGANTDAYGFIENIRASLPIRKHKAVVLGAGGAARAVCHALVQAGFAQVVVLNRTPERAEALAALYPDKLVAKPWNARSAELQGAELLVNTTSLGLSGKDPLEIDLSALPKSSVVTDIVYSPLITPLLEKAAAHGNKIVDGLGMLIHQAVPGFEAWFGHKPIVTRELRQYLLSE